VTGVILGSWVLLVFNRVKLRLQLAALRLFSRWFFLSPLNSFTIEIEAVLGAKAPKKEPKHLGRIAHPTISSTLSLFRFDFDFGIFSINFAPKIRWGQIGLGRKMNHGCWWFLEVFFCFFLGRCGTANGLPLK